MSDSAAIGGTPTGHPVPTEQADDCEHVVDSRGTRCPQPVIDLARVAAHSQAGATLRLLADDPAARYDVPAWCRMRGHRLISATVDGPVLGFDVVLGQHQG